MGSNPTVGMEVCICIYSVFVGSGLVTGLSLVQGVLPSVRKVIMELKERQGPVMAVEPLGKKISEFNSECLLSEKDC
jgi:hypothetical protein